MKKDSTSEDQSTRRVTPSSLAFQWRKNPKSNWHSDDYITTTHLGQLKHFIQSTGSQATEAMYFAIDNWSKFYPRVLEVKAPKYWTFYPDITFMCSHSDILLLCMNEKDSPYVEVKKHFHGHPKPTFQVSPLEPKATLEDVQSSLKKLAEITALNQNS